MIYISHRGNLHGPNLENENKPKYILEALSKIECVEIDVWHTNGDWFLGHDKPTYKINNDFLMNERLWCHAKNIEALEKMNIMKNNYFWHQSDDVTLTSRGYIWTYPGKQLTSRSIAVMPEVANIKKLETCAGVCSDFIMEWKK